MTVMTKTMTTESSMHFSHNKPNDTPWRADGLREQPQLRRVEPDLKRSSQRLPLAARAGVDRIAQGLLERIHALVGDLLETVGRLLGGTLARHRTCILWGEGWRLERR